MESNHFVRKLERLGINTRVLGILALLIVLWTFLSIYAGDKFYGLNNIENLLKRTGLYGILGIGVAFVIITSGIDLSIGSLVCLMACLLSVFLHVDYTPPTLESVVEVRAAEKVIVVPGGAETYAEGDRIRFFGGNYAGNAMRTVVSRAETKTKKGKVATAITVDAPLSRDDAAGSLVHLHAISDAGKATVDQEAEKSFVTFKGDYTHLQPRDRIDFMKPAGAENKRSDYDDYYKDAEIVSVALNDGATRIGLKSDHSRLTSDWIAILKPRHQTMSVPMALLSLFAIALLLGLLHGLLVTKLSLQPFVVTLCGLLIYRGVSRSLMNDQVGGFGNEYETFQQLGAGKWTLWESAGGTAFGLPYPFLVLVVAGIAAAVFLNRTIWGRYLLALGRNEEAARYSGINTSRMIILAYVISVMASAIGGVLFALYSNSIPPSSFGAWYELYAIAAAVLGGCSLRGGEGSIFGVIVGAALMQTLSNLIQMLDIPGFAADQIELAVIGAVILIGVSIDEIVRRIVAGRRAKPIEETPADVAQGAA